MPFASPTAHPFSFWRSTMPPETGFAAKSTGKHVGVVSSANSADTLLACVIVTEQLPVPLQSPDQPTKRDPSLAEALRLTTCEGRKLEEHAGARRMPEGTLQIVPSPDPAIHTLRGTAPTERSQTAADDQSETTVTPAQILFARTLKSIWRGDVVERVSVTSRPVTEVDDAPVKAGLSASSKS